MLANVLRGDMSIVGISFMNRNELPLTDEALVLQRTELKPGLLKWSRTFERPAPIARSRARVRIEDDLHYIANWSLLLDAKIILKALFAKSSYALDGEDDAIRWVNIGRS
jgi:lipopolysaccharide/colanic/teichoic acid biosynthesis glycosyltransferase